MVGIYAASETKVFNLLDRVARPIKPGDIRKGFRRGQIVKVRFRPGQPNAPLYDVEWDDKPGIVDKGYLAHGLMPEILAS